MVLAEKAATLAKDLEGARHRIRNHPALLKLQNEQDMRRAIEAQCNTALQKLSGLSNLNLECQAWKDRVVAANEMRDAQLSRRAEVILATSLMHEYGARL